MLAPDFISENGFSERWSLTPSATGGVLLVCYYGDKGGYVRYGLSAKTAECEMTLKADRNRPSGFATVKMECR